MPDFELKQGEPFVLNGQRFDADQTTPLPLTGITVKSQVRTKDDTLIADLTYSVIDNNAGQYRLMAAQGTLDWPPGLLYVDIKEIESGVSALSKTLSIELKRAVTRS